MTTKRQQIFAQIKTTLESVSSIKSVEVNKTSVIDIETVAFPCAFIFFDRETKLRDDRSVIGYENWEMLVNIEVWSDERNDQEDLLGAIHTAMAADHQIGGLAATSHREGASLFVLDPTRSISSMILDYSIIYRHKNGIP